MNSIRERLGAFEDTLYYHISNKITQFDISLEADPSLNEVQFLLESQTNEVTPQSIGRKNPELL